MRICIIGNTLGNLDRINQYAKQSKADLVLCSGDFGILPNNFYEIPEFFDNNNFNDYLMGDKSFDVPVVSVYGPHDNISMKEKIYSGDFYIDNFTLLKNAEIVATNGVSICGVGGTYSPRVYEKGYQKYRDGRHFTKEEIEKVKDSKFDILLIHDLIGECTKKYVGFSEETDYMIYSTMPKYCFMGRFGWWGNVKNMYTMFVSCPTSDKGYMVLDTDTWDSYGIRLDLEE